MTRCPIDNCTEVTDMKRTLYGTDGTGGLVGCSKRLYRVKVSWTQLGSLIGILAIILGLTYARIDWGYAGNIEKVQKDCDANKKIIQTYSVNQAVIKEKITTIDQKLNEVLKQAEKDQHDILKAIKAIGK